jgi:TrmH family RNA methyltransferase
MEKISTQSTPSGVLALLTIPNFKVPDQRNSVLAIDGIRDPGNLGTLIRTADWFGVQEVWCSSDCADIYNPKTVQASMGSLFRVGIHQLALAESLASDTRKSYAAVLNGETVIPINKNEAVILVIGSESHGISPAVLEQTAYKISIPGIGKTESLNAAVAGGILMWEMWGH